MSNTANYGLALFGLDPFGSEFGTFGVAGATAYNDTTVQVRFTAIIDPTDLSFTSLFNYSIDPPLIITSVSIESADSVLLRTEPQELLTYTVTVVSGRSSYRIPLNPLEDQATFVGVPPVPGYLVAATTPVRVRCIFNLQMQVGPVTTPSNFLVQDLNGNSFSVASVTAEQTGNPFSVVLQLTTPLSTTSWYVVTINPAVVSTGGHSPAPLTQEFQFIQGTQTTQVAIEQFSGEVQGGMYGFPDGLVFFSPSLNVAASNSEIQVEEVDCCTVAYDQYVMPVAVDPDPFFVWGPPSPVTTLGQAGIVLWAAFPRLSEASFDLGFTGSHLVEPMPQAFDGSCSLVMRAAFAPGYVALLNNLTWNLFDQNPLHETTPPMFICANITSGPIPPGGEQIIILHCAIVGESTMTVQALPLHHEAVASIQGGSTFTTDPQAKASLVAWSLMRVARSSQNHGATAAILAGSHMLANGPLPSPSLWGVASILGFASMQARVPQHYSVSASSSGAALVAASAT